MITVGGKVINPEHVILVVHPSHSAYVQVYLSTSKTVEISAILLEGMRDWDTETPLQVITRLLDEHRRAEIHLLAQAIRG